MPIRCEIVSQDRMVYEGDVDIVVAPGEMGEMGILPNHAPLLSTLKYGILTVRKQGLAEHFTIAGGIIEVQPDIITILADVAENVREIDIARAEAARKRAEEFLFPLESVEVVNAACVREPARCATTSDTLIAESHEDFVADFSVFVGFLERDEFEF